MKVKRINYLVIDVDGTMTDGGVYYDENGNEMKKFCTIDAAGFFAARNVGIKIIILTGRECKATIRRMSELKVDYLFQNIQDKYLFLKDFMEENGILSEQLGYIGDDLNDISSMALAGFVGCPADSCLEVRKKANYISKRSGGKGAVRDIIEHMLRESGEWEQAIADVYGIGR